VPLHRLTPVDGVRELQRKLWTAAKQSEGRRFHALYDRICRRDVLWMAWDRVRANRGAAGVDKMTLEAVEDFGVARLLEELAADLRAGTYRPMAVRRVEIPKPDGRLRPLGIPTVRDRVAQQAAKIILEPIFQARVVISDWRHEYTRIRPHSSLNYLTPAAYAAVCTHRNNHQELSKTVDRFPGTGHGGQVSFADSHRPKMRTP